MRNHSFNLLPLPDEHKPAYRTLTAPGEGEFRDRGSRFYSYVYPADERATVDSRLKEIQELHPEARHIVYAFRLGEEEFSTDAGEPAGSSGPPVLRVLKSEGLTHAVAIVVRYFGGTKLGIPGLLAAYEAATRAALATTEACPWFATRVVEFSFPYSATATIERLQQQFRVIIEHQDYAAQVSHRWRIRVDEAEELLPRLKKTVTSLKEIASK